VVLGPDYLVGEDVQAGRLIRLLPNYVTPDTPVSAVYPPGDHLSAKTRTFIDFLAARFARSRPIAQASGNGKDVAQSLDRAARANTETGAGGGPPPVSPLPQ